MTNKQLNYNTIMIAPNTTYIVCNTYSSLPEYPCYTI